MVGVKIDGKVIAQSVKDRVKKATEELKNQGISPCLAYHGLFLICRYLILGIL